jgi:hypothetical protein
MKRFGVSKRAVLLAVLAGLAFTFAARRAEAQSCRPSQLFYVVRDERGRVMDPAGLQAPNFIEDMIGVVKTARDSTGSMAVEIGLDKEKTRSLLLQKFGSEKVRALYEVRGSCRFSETINFKLTLHQKNMNLILKVRGAGDFLVDSLPFQQGTFQIDLSNPPGRGFFPATMWRKVSDKAEAPTPIPVRSVTGYVRDAVTKKPIAGAEVVLDTAPRFYQEDETKWKTVTDARGRFEIENLRGDWLSRIYAAALVVKHADYPTHYSPLFTTESGEKTGELPRVEDRVIELAPFVTVSGRVIDEATGQVPAEAGRIGIMLTYRGGGDIGHEIEVPEGVATVQVRADGTFTVRTLPGYNTVQGSENYSRSDGCGKCYELATGPNPMRVAVPQQGLSDLIIKVREDKSSQKKAK